MKLGHEESYRGSLAKLASAQIVICGAGALGSNLADTLCRQGATKIRVVDFDRVEEGNAATQIYGLSDVGAMKVAALKARLFRDTGVEIETIDKRMTEVNREKFTRGADLIVDAFDNSASRLLLSAQNRECIHAGTWEGYSEVVWNDVYRVPADAPKDAMDACDYPLARNLITLTVSILAEEIVDFLLAPKPRRASWSVTLKDLAARKYR